MKQAIFLHGTKIFNIVYSQTNWLQYGKELIVSVINVYDYYSQSVYYDNV